MAHETESIKTLTDDGDALTKKEREIKSNLIGQLIAAKLLGRGLSKSGSQQNLRSLQLADVRSNALHQVSQQEGQEIFEISFSS
jgi:hypothetical protein